MNKSTKALETEARANVRKLRAVPGMEKIADSLERLMDGASEGGKARAKNLTAAQRSEIASKAAKARWNKKRTRKQKEAK